MAKVYKNPGPIEFDGVLREKDMGNNVATWVDFPYDLKETFGVGNLVPYTVTFDGRVHYQGSLAKMGGPQAMILLRNDVRTELGKQAGEKVHVRVELDTSERKVILAGDIKAVLKKADLRVVFDKLAYSHQREYNMWIEDAKKPETRVARIQKMCEQLSANKK